MAAFTTMALVGAAVLGSASSAMQQRRARKDQEKAMREQEEAARIAASNASAIRDPEELTAEVSLGRGKASQPTGVLESSGGAASQTGSVSARVGGLKKRASSGLGL